MAQSPPTRVSRGATASTRCGTAPTPTRRDDHGTPSTREKKQTQHHTSRLLDEYFFLVLLLDVVVDLDGRVLLLRREDAHAARVAQRVLEDVVRDDVELLLLLALDVDVARIQITRQARQRTSSY